VLADDDDDGRRHAGELVARIQALDEGIEARLIVAGRRLKVAA
jgi:hypothetical protein